MFFKLSNSLNNMEVTRQRLLPVEVKLDDETSFELWRREVNQNGSPQGQLCCSVVAETQPSENVVNVLGSIAEGILPTDQRPDIALPIIQSDVELVSATGRIREGTGIGPELLPTGVADYLLRIETDLNEKLVDFVGTLRWRQKAAGGHRPFSFIEFCWSIDGKVWQRVPTTFNVSIFQPRTIQVSQNDLNEITKLLLEGVTEPFAHELVRESRELVQNAPRSALLIAAAALETGAKSYIAALVPNSEPLISKLQSPSVLTLLNQVIPEVHRNLGHDCPLLPLGKEAREYLKKWVAQRNDVAHGRKEKIVGDELKDFIGFVEELLYLLDSLRGVEWAETFIVDAKILQQ